MLTTAGHYPPWEYAVLGVLTRPINGVARQVFGMRVVGAFLAGALLASALATLRAARAPCAGVGLALGLTPMALFLAGVVNPSGLEIAAGAAVWTHGAALALERVSGEERRVALRLGLAAAVLVLIRPLSPVWLGLAGVVLLVATGRRLVPVILSLWPRLRRPAIAVAVALVFQAAWWVAEDPLNHRYLIPRDAGFVPLVDQYRVSIGKGFLLLREMIGVFGWLDTPAPVATLVIWLVVLGALLGLAVLASRASIVSAIVAAIAVTIAVPVLLEVMNARDVGFIWQGRYTLPFAVGIPILAGFAVNVQTLESRGLRRFVVGVWGLLAFAHVLAYWQALRRYTVGSNGSLLLSGARWQPPLPARLLVVVAAVVLTAAVGWVISAAQPWLGSTASPRTGSAPPVPDQAAVEDAASIGSSTTTV